MRSNKLPNKYNNVQMGWSGSNSLVDDIKSNMVQLTENAEEMAIAVQ